MLSAFLLYAPQCMKDPALSGIRLETQSVMHQKKKIVVHITNLAIVTNLF